MVRPEDLVEGGRKPPSFAPSSLGTSLPSGVTSQAMCWLLLPLGFSFTQSHAPSTPPKNATTRQRRTPLLPWHPPPCPGEGSSGLRALLSHLLGWAGAGTHPKWAPGWG